MADTRRRLARDRGKSDRIDAIAVARAALREGLETLPAVQLEGPELDLRLLVDHRERLIRQRVALNNTLQWHLHDLWPELQLPGSSLFYGNWGPRIARRLARAEQTMRVRIARDECDASASPQRDQRGWQRQIAQLVAQIAPQLLTEPGFGPLIAAKLVGEVACASRFANDAKLARAAGVAPIPVSSGKTNRHRLDRGGNRQINAVDPSRRRHPAALPSRDPGLHRPQTRRRQEHQRSHPLPQTPPRPPRLAPPPDAPPIPDQEHRHHHQSLDIGAAKAALANEGASSRLLLVHAGRLTLGLRGAPNRAPAAQRQVAKEKRRKRPTCATRPGSYPPTSNPPRRYRPWPKCISGTCIA